MVSLRRAGGGVRYGGQRYEKYGHVIYNSTYRRKWITTKEYEYHYDKCVDMKTPCSVMATVVGKKHDDQRRTERQRSRTKMLSARQEPRRSTGDEINNSSKYVKKTAGKFIGFKLYMASTFSPTLNTQKDHQTRNAVHIRRLLACAGRQVEELVSGREQEELDRLAEGRRVASLREIRLQVMSPKNGGDSSFHDTPRCNYRWCS